LGKTTGFLGKILALIPKIIEETRFLGWNPVATIETYLVGWALPTIYYTGSSK